MLNTGCGEYLFLCMCRTPTTKTNDWLLSSISKKTSPPPRSPQAVYLLTVRNDIFFFSNFVSQRGLLFPDKLWIYVLLRFHVVVLSHWSMCVWKQQGWGFRLLGHSKLCFYVGSIKKAFIAVIHSTSVLSFFISRGCCRETLEWLSVFCIFEWVIIFSFRRYCLFSDSV